MAHREWHGDRRPEGTDRKVDATRAVLRETTVTVAEAELVRVSGAAVVNCFVRNTMESWGHNPAFHSARTWRQRSAIETCMSSHYRHLVYALYLKHNCCGGCSEGHQAFLGTTRSSWSPVIEIRSLSTVWPSKSSLCPTSTGHETDGGGPGRPGPRQTRRARQVSVSMEVYRHRCCGMKIAPWTQ